MPRLSTDVATRRPDEADLASTDEVIVYKDEGDADDAKCGLVENLTEEKLGLLTETEQVHHHRTRLLPACQSFVVPRS